MFYLTTNPNRRFYLLKLHVRNRSYKGIYSYKRNVLLTMYVTNPLDSLQQFVMNESVMYLESAVTAPL